MTTTHSDICILGATPAGICSAIAAARDGATVALIERTGSIGGLPANGLGATDIHLREATTGLFAAFVEGNRRYYEETYGPASEQLVVSRAGLHFEPSVAAQTFRGMLEPWRERITLLLEQEFDHTDGSSIILSPDEGAVTRTITSIRLRRRANDAPTTTITAAVFLDCTYEGDLMAAAGVDYATGRESRDDLGESYAGVIYKTWMGDPDLTLSTGDGDDRLQAYNYRLCLTTDPANRIPFAQPAGYDRGEYTSLIGDIHANRWTGHVTNELEVDTIGRVVNIIPLPNGKTDANNQHLSFLSTDLPGENSLWPNASWSWRDTFAERLRSYTEGLLWFMATDSQVPRAIREAVSQYGWPRDEYQDNGGFPRAVYVREARRMRGRYVFSQHDVALKYPDALSRLAESRRGQHLVHPTSITAGCYAIDSHPTRKREPNTPSLEGMYSKSVVPHTIPYEVMVPTSVSNLLVPVAASATHVGYSTLRMEPVWMGLGEAAGAAAAIAVASETKCAVSDVPIGALQSRLLSHGATLVYDERLAGAGQSERAEIQRALLAGVVIEE